MTVTLILGMQIFCRWCVLYSMVDVAALLLWDSTQVFKTICSLLRVRCAAKDEGNRVLASYPGHGRKGESSLVPIVWACSSEETLQIKQVSRNVSVLSTMMQCSMSWLWPHTLTHVSLFFSYVQPASITPTSSMKARTCKCKILSAEFAILQSSFNNHASHAQYCGCTAVIAADLHTNFVEKKPSHLFCPLGAHQEAGKAVVISKWCQNFWTKSFHRKLYDKTLHKEFYAV